MSSELSTIEVMPTAAVEVMQRAEIDTQIATAHKYPRSMATFQTRAKGMALIDEETAASCIYSRPVGGNKFAEGLSVRAAEIVGAAYGNLRVGATVIEQTDRYVKARGFAHDLESNFACATEVIESTVKKDGTPYDERMRIVIAKSCLAKARRDATFQVVPKALFRSIELECKKLALGEGQSITTRRARISQWITKLGIEPKRVWAALGVVGEADLTDEHFITLTGIKTAIADGDVTIDEAFPKVVTAGKIGANPLDDKKPSTSSVGTEAPGSTGEPLGGGEPVPETAAPASTPQEKPKAAEKKAQPKAEEPKAPVQEATPNVDELRTELEAKCQAAGIETSDLALYLASQSFVPKGTTFKGFTVLQIQAVLKSWDDVRDGVKSA